MFRSPAACTGTWIFISLFMMKHKKKYCHSFVIHIYSLASFSSVIFRTSWGRDDEKFWAWNIRWKKVWVILPSTSREKMKRFLCWKVNHYMSQVPTTAFCSMKFTNFSSYHHPNQSHNSWTNLLKYQKTLSSEKYASHLKYLRTREPK